jgi:uncharacterized membrane protein YcaP (DUF421 family)
MDLLTDTGVRLFGVMNHLSLAQECARAVLIFLYGLLLLRLTGRRAFGHWSALDVILSIIVGSALARALTGSAPLPGTMAAAAVLALLHWLMAHCVARYPGLGRWIEGAPVVLMQHGHVNDAVRRRHMISQSDLAEALRQEGIDDLGHAGNVKVMTLEPSGKISVVKHDSCKPEFP